MKNYRTILSQKQWIYYYKTIVGKILRPYYDIKQIHTKEWYPEHLDKLLRNMGEMVVTLREQEVPYIDDVGAVIDDENMSKVLHEIDELHTKMVSSSSAGDVRLFDAIKDVYTLRKLLIDGSSEEL